MPVMQKCPDDHPLMIAWTAYQKTEDYQNSYNWATKGIDYMVLPEPKDPTANRYTHEHYRQFVQGSLWAAFMAGFNASMTAPTDNRTPISRDPPASPRAEGEKSLVEFARWAITEGPFEGCHLDGSDIQDKAEKLGILIKTKYDPAIHGESAEAEPGDDWYVFAPLVADQRLPETK
jgi:hypothetical protein